MIWTLFALTEQKALTQTQQGGATTKGTYNLCISFDNESVICFDNILHFVASAAFCC